MALLGNLLGTVDGLLGADDGTNGTVDVSQTLGVDAGVATNPSVDLAVADLVGASVSAPTVVGASADVDADGLLNGLV